MSIYVVDMGGGKTKCNILEDISYTLTTTHYGEPVVAYRKEEAMKVGDVIVIDWMKDVPGYTGRKGTITHIDDMGQLHGTWGGLAVIPGEDEFHIEKV